MIWTNIIHITGGPWYNISICKKIHGTVFEEFIRNARTDKHNLMCKNSIHHLLMMASELVVTRYLQIQQHKY